MFGHVTTIIRPREHARDRGGYFYVRGDDGHDRFAHARDLVDGAAAFAELCEGTRVEFDPLVVVNSPKGNGLRAEHVRVAL